MSNTSTELPTARFTDGDPMRVVGLSRHYDAAARDLIPQQWADLQQRSGDLQGRIGSARFGIIYPAGEKSQDFEYLTTVLIDEGAVVPNGFVERRLPARRHVVFTYRGDPSGLPELMHRIFCEWLPQANQEIAGAPSPLLVEVYEDTYVPNVDSEFEVWIPLKDQ